mgnify:FL=1
MTDTKTTSVEASILKKYFTTDGRATRPEYWAMVIITSVVTALALMLLAIEAIVPILIAFIAFVAVIWYSIATSVRRLNDCGLNPWWILAILIPWVGGVFSIVIGCLSSKD